jgi:hypothetical protein
MYSVIGVVFAPTSSQKSGSYAALTVQHSGRGILGDLLATLLINGHAKMHHTGGKIMRIRCTFTSFFSNVSPKLYSYKMVRPAMLIYLKFAIVDVPKRSTSCQ